MATSIKEQDVHTWSERLKSFFNSVLIIGLGIFIRDAILPHLVPKEGDTLASFSLFHFLDYSCENKTTGTGSTERSTVVPSEKVRHRPVAKDPLREPLLPVIWEE